MTLYRPLAALAALAVLACASASAAPAQPEFKRFEGTSGATAKSAVVHSTATVPPPHKHVMKAVTRADGSVDLVCAAEPNEKFVAFERERERAATQEK